MPTAGRPRTPVPASVQVKVQLLLRRDPNHWTLRRIARTLGLSYSVVRRIALDGCELLKLSAPIDCPRCGHTTAVAPCPRCGATEFDVASLATVDPDRGPSPLQAVIRDRIRAEKMASDQACYSAGELDAKYYALRVHRVGHG